MLTADSCDYVYWCRNCAVPILQSFCENCGSPGIKMGRDLKPIFTEERILIEKLVEESLPVNTRLLWMGNGTIWYNGNRYMRFSTNNNLNNTPLFNPQELVNELPEDNWLDNLWNANSSRLISLEKEALSFIEHTASKYSNRVPIVSFSGGKDSTLVSNLVTKALETNAIPHVFADTTIEFPDTYQYIKDFHIANSNIPMIIEKAPADWIYMCQVLGIPSRFFPWCCSVFKASPISAALSKLSELNNGRDLLNFEGIRRKESNKRRHRDRINVNLKLKKQISAEPIIEWKTIELWLYMLCKKIDFNVAYRKGFRRVGCLYCPHNPHSSQVYLSFHFPNEINKWKQFVIKQAKSLGKRDPEEYWQSEAWKISLGNDGSSRIRIERKPCSDGSNIFNYILQKKFTRSMLEYFKVFGKIKEIRSPMGIGASVMKGRKTLFLIEGVDGFPRLKITLLVTSDHTKLLKDIERQIKKMQACELCGACRGICPRGAINIEGLYAIDEHKCNHCLMCLRTKPLQNSCIAVEAKRRFLPIGVS